MAQIIDIWPVDETEMHTAGWGVFLHEENDNATDENLLRKFTTLGEAQELLSAITSGVLQTRAAIAAWMPDADRAAEAERKTLVTKGLIERVRHNHRNYPKQPSRSGRMGRPGSARD